MNPLLCTDGYKTGHHLLYPPNITKVYSNFTPRSTKLMPVQAKEIVVFGTQYTILYIKELWDTYFFQWSKEHVCREAKEYLSAYLGMDYDVSHFERLHDLGYLPLEIKALPEGTISREGIPILTICNTIPEFYWLTNFLETLLSSLLWKPLHSASMVRGFKKILTKYAKETDQTNLAFVDFQGHDFSYRGLQHHESAISSGMGFLTSFKGTDTIPALQGAYHYYGEKNAGFSVPASEHSTVTAWGKEDEIDAFRRILNVFPKGVVSMVSDSFNLWDVLTKYLPILKEEILARDGKLVIRPDSGDPVDIICGISPWGNKEAWDKNHLDIEDIPKGKGVIELLWDVFGGTTNEQGYKVLDPHIGAILGDGVTLDRTEQICRRLKAKGFASTNLVFGIGSYSMGYATRDQMGCAVKSTYVEVTSKVEIGYDENGEPTYTYQTEPREIFKDPITDDGLKKSAKGLLRVEKVLNPGGDGTSLKLIQQCTKEMEEGGELKTVFLDGKLVNPTTLSEIRNRLSGC